MKKPKRKISKLGLYVGFSIGFCVLYTIAIVCIFATTGLEPENLTKYVYGFFGGEVVSAALIKLFNIGFENWRAYKGSDNSSEDIEEMEDEIYG